ncbi:hypothetical protein [Massilia aerilata]|uniref:Uncharacterized protein n=1 Tax=Massilia aerilata TaxID=453817 RepID=A0ABW0RVK4_9BURK
MAGMRYQPQGGQRIDQSNPIGRSLAFAVHGGAGLRELVAGGAATGRGSAQAIKGFAGGLAYDLRAVNAGTFYSARTAAALLVSDQTAIFDIVIAGAPSGSRPSLGGMWRSTTQDDAWLSIDRDTADTLQVNFRIAGANGSRSFAIGASSLYGRRLIIAASVTRGSSGSGTVYLRVAADGGLLYDLSSIYSGNGSTDVTPTGTEYVSVGSESIENPSRNCNAIQYGQYHLGRVVTAAEVASLSTQPWQLFAAATDEENEGVDAAVADMSLNGAATASASGAGGLSTSLRLIGAAAVLAAAAGSLSTSIPVQGAASVQASGTGALTTAIQQAGAAVGQASGTGSLSTSIALQGAAVARASASGDLAGGAAALSGTATSQATGAATLSTAISLQGSTSAVATGGAALTSSIRLAGGASALAVAVGSLSDALPGGGIVVDVSRISPERIVVFDGSGSRVVVFEGSGSRIVIFESSGPRVRFNQMSVSAKVPVKIGDKWTVDRDPDEISYYAADITQELLDRNTSADPSKIAPLLFGVGLLEGPDLQVETIEGVPRTFVVVKLGGVDEDLPTDWRWVARVPCLNGERFDKTTWFNKVDP